MGAAVLLAVVPFVARPLFDVSVDALDEISAGAFVGSLFGVLVLIAVPVMMLGAASPYAIRLAVPDVEHAGPGGRAPVRDLDRRSLARDVAVGARPDPADRDAAHIPQLRPRGRGVAAIGLGGATRRSPSRSPE